MNTNKVNDNDNQAIQAPSIKGESSKPKIRPEFSYTIGKTIMEPVDTAEKQSLAISPGSKHCNICTEEIEIFAIGSCNHCYCHLCSLRIRSLYKSNTCPMCKTVLNQIVFTTDPLAAFDSFKPLGRLPKDPKLQIYFENREIKETTSKILLYNCPVLECDATFLGWKDLKKHARSIHSLVFCDVCIQHKKVFSHEFTLFEPSEVSKHSKEVHKDCGFCNTTFYGVDELYDHCRHNHEECFLCKRNGIRDVYFENFGELEGHFKDDHFMCPEPACLEKKMVVFDSEMDLKAHEMEEHRKEYQQQKGGKRNKGIAVNIDFTYGEPRRQIASSSSTREKGRKTFKPPPMEPPPSSSNHEIIEELSHRNQKPHFPPSIPKPPPRATVPAPIIESSSSESSPRMSRNRNYRQLNAPPGFGSVLTIPPPQVLDKNKKIGTYQKTPTPPSPVEPVEDFPLAPNMKSVVNKLSNITVTEKFPKMSNGNANKRKDSTKNNSSLINDLLDLFGRDKFDEFKSLTSAFKNNILSSDELLKSFATFVTNTHDDSGAHVEYSKEDVVQIDKLWKRLVDDLYKNLGNRSVVDSKRSELLRSLNDFKIKQDQLKYYNSNQTKTTDWQKPTSSSSSTSATASPTAKVLVIKPGAKIPRTKSSSSSRINKNFYDRVAERMMESQEKEKSEFPSLVPGKPTASGVWGADTCTRQDLGFEDEDVQVKKGKKGKKVLLKWG